MIKKIKAKLIRRKIKSMKWQGLGIVGSAALLSGAFVIAKKLIKGKATA